MIASITPPKRHVLSEDEIDFLFNDMDTDKNGTLCIDEFTSFCLGRFSVTREVAKSIFEANDVDKNSVIDRKEFGLVFRKLEQAVNSVDYEANKQVLRHISCAAQWNNCAILCGVCTLGLSCCVAKPFALRHLQKSQEVLEKAENDKEPRIVEALQQPSSNPMNRL